LSNERNFFRFHHISTRNDFLQFCVKNLFCTVHHKLSDMKTLKINAAYLVLSLGLIGFSCGTTNDSEKSIEGSGSATQSTPNDSSEAKSVEPLGQGDDNQKDSLGYPSNQSNLNADSTRRKHD
jgi:hypothetical protein